MAVLLSYAQSSTPDKVNFQAVARDGSGNIVVNQPISVYFTIFDSLGVGNADTLRKLLFVNVNTDDYGQFEVILQEGIPSVFYQGPTPLSDIKWYEGHKRIRIDYQPPAGALNSLGIFDCNTMFYAFHSRTAEELKTAGTDGQVLKYNGTTNKWEADVDNDTQYSGSSTISINGSNAISVAPNSIGATQLSITSLPPNGAAGGSLAGTYPNPTLSNNSVNSAQIADNSITANDISSGVIPTSLPPNGPASGSLTGTYPNPTLSNNSVGSAQIIDNSITANDISSGVIPTAGAGITINGSNQIVATDPSIINELPTAGAGISVIGNTVSVKSVNDYAVFEHQENIGIDGGSCISGWQIRNLNTQVVNVGSAISPLANQTITLQPGTYYIKGYAFAYRCDEHQVALVKAVPVPLLSDYVLYGTSGYANSTESNAGYSFIDGYITITVQTSYILRHYTETARAGDGLGFDTGAGLQEVYARVVIQKIQ